MVGAEGVLRFGVVGAVGGREGWRGGRCLGVVTGGVRLGVVGVGTGVLCCGSAGRGGFCDLRGFVWGEGGEMGRGCFDHRSCPFKKVVKNA